jgi:esterase/lipase superfamily enzyme
MRLMSLVLVLLILSADFALGDDREICADGEPKSQVDACSRFILANKGGPQNIGGAYNNRGLAYSRLGQHARAILDLDEAVRLRSDDAVPLVNRGIARCRQGRSVLGLGDLSEAIALSPASPEAFYNRGICRLVGDQLDEAVADFARALAIDPENAGAHYARYLALTKKNDNKKALGAYAIAVRLDPAIASDGDRFSPTLMEPGEERIGKKKGRRARAKGPGGCATALIYDSARRACVDPRTGKVLEYSTVDLFYGTNREKSPGEARISYGKEPAPALALGRAQVTVPVERKLGEIRRPWWITRVTYRLAGISENPRTYFTIQNVTELDRNQFKEAARSALQSGGTFAKQALVFVHGYNVSFDDALYRLAQIVVDLGFDGVPFLYSWPSAGELTPYRDDRGRAENSVSALREFLDFVIAESDAEKVHLVGHSMGTVALTRALKDMKESGRNYAKVSEIILAAPDIGIAEFEGLAGAISGFGGGKTLYASSKDLALLASMAVWGEDRAGFVTGSGPLVVGGVETVDVSATNTDFLGHSSYAGETELLNDLMLLFQLGKHPPKVRAPILGVGRSQRGDYWVWPN